MSELYVEKVDVSCSTGSEGACGYYMHWFCSGNPYSACSYGSVTDDPYAKCPCGRCLSYSLTYISPPVVKGGVVATGGFVKDVMKFLVMDDLVVKPVSVVSSITSLNRYFNVKDVCALHEEVVHFGKEEALKSTFESKAVLTSASMSSVIKSRVKVET